MGIYYEYSYYWARFIKQSSSTRRWKIFTQVTCKSIPKGVGILEWAGEHARWTGRHDMRLLQSCLPDQPLPQIADR